MLKAVYTLIISFIKIIVIINNHKRKEKYFVISRKWNHAGEDY